jgi:hypothetical protein
MTLCSKIMSRGILTTSLTHVSFGDNPLPQSVTYYLNGPLQLSRSIETSGLSSNLFLSRFRQVLPLPQRLPVKQQLPV